jgi:hypothetical protein
MRLSRPASQTISARRPRRPYARRRSTVCALVLALMLAFAPGSAPRASEFVPGIEDLPLMGELHAIEGSGFAFDTAAGRLVEAYAGGSVSQDDVDEFYNETLPQLGWEAEGDRLWRREGETLTIEFVDGVDPVTIRFQLSPQ